MRDYFMSSHQTEIIREHGNMSYGGQHMINPIKTFPPLVRRENLAVCTWNQ